MAIDTNVRTNTGFLKWITVAKLKALLQELDDELSLYSNCVGNLSIVKNKECIGHIDIAAEELEMN